jgi:hypothetical protein
LAFWGSVGLLVLPAEAGVTGVGIIAWSGDADLRQLRHPAAWDAVMARLPGGNEILAATPIDDQILVMAGIEDRFRRYVVDGDPVATGVVTHQTPWYRSTVWHDRHRTADFQQAIAGTERQPDELWDRFLAFEHAAFGDMALLPHFLSTFRLDRRTEDVLTDPEVVAHLEAAGHQPRTTGPTRSELLSAIADA